MNHIRTCTGSGPTEKPKQQRSEYSLVPLLWLASETLKEEKKKMFLARVGTGLDGFHTTFTHQ